MTMMILTMMTMILVVMMSWQKGTPGLEPGMVPLRIVLASMFPISIVSLLSVPLSIVPRSECPIIQLSVVTLSVVHVSIVHLAIVPLSHCAMSIVPLLPFFPTVPVSQNPTVLVHCPLGLFSQFHWPNVPLSISPWSTVRLSIVPWSLCFLAHCVLQSRPTQPPVRRRFEKPDLFFVSGIRWVLEHSGDSAVGSA